MELSRLYVESAKLVFFYLGYEKLILIKIYVSDLQALAKIYVGDFQVIITKYDVINRKDIDPRISDRRQIRGLVSGLNIARGGWKGSVSACTQTQHEHKN
jgi:hypothetical protein